jgi:ribokinase
VADNLLAPGTLVMLQMEVPHAENWRLVERAKRQGARVLLNCAPAGEVPRDVLIALDWLVVNETEAAILAQALSLPAANPRTAGQAIATSTSTAVIATLGAEGAIAFAHGKTWICDALPIRPTDTTAAGDAFVGAFAAAIDSGGDLPEALRRASVAGGLACTSAGAQPSLPSRGAIEAHLRDLSPPRQV